MMDCLTFRRQLLEDPTRHDPALGDHQHHCPACAGFARSLRADEARLHDALNVPPPAALAERIQLSVSLDVPPIRRSNRRWLAVAASGLLAIGAASWGWLHFSHPYQDLSLERSVMHHVADEVAHLYEPGPAPTDDLQQVFARFGASVSPDELGRVNFAGICAMRGGNGVHLVVQGEQGPVTVFFMPGEKAREELTLHSARFAGLIEPTTWGSIAVVGEQGENLRPVLQRVRQAVRWPSDRLSGLSTLNVSPLG